MLITFLEAARRLGVHVATLRAWVREGKVPAYRLGQRFARVDWEEVLAALSEQRQADEPRKAAPEVADVP
jgi:excisionase family DNA binding protein